MALTYQERLERGWPLYVRNMTTDPRSTITVTLKWNGNSQMICIPATQYPVEIVPALASREMVMHGGHQLNTFIQSGHLRLVPGKKARTELNDPRAKEEVKSLMLRSNSDSTSVRWAQSQMREYTDSGIRGKNKAGPSGPSTEMPDILKRDAWVDAQQKAKEAQGGPSLSRHQLHLGGAPTDVSSHLLGIMSRWSPERDEGIVRDLKSVRSSLTLEDLQYVMTASQRHSRTWLFGREELSKYEDGE
jgi:hypothetical protein